MDMRGRYNRSIESRDRSSISRRKYFGENQDARDRVSANTKDQWSNPETRENILSAVRKIGNRPEVIEARRIKAIERWKNPEFRAKVILAQSGPNNSNWNPDRSQVGRRNGKDFQKAQIRRLLKDNCEWCGSADSLQLDHIIPVCAGGDSIDSNAQTLCAKCNNKKRVTIDMDLMKKWRENGGHLDRDNTVPSWVRNSLEGVETKGRVVRRIGTKFLRIELSCDCCGNTMQKTPHQLKSHDNHFCSHGCRMIFLNGRSKTDSNTLTSAPRESDDIVRTA